MTWPFHLVQMEERAVGIGLPLAQCCGTVAVNSLGGHVFAERGEGEGLNAGIRLQNSGQRRCVYTQRCCACAISIVTTALQERALV